MSEEEEYVAPQATMNSFKLEPRQEQFVGVRIDYIVNMRGLGQWLCIQDLDGERRLFLVTAQEGLEGDPLEDTRHPKSDRV